MMSSETYCCSYRLKSKKAPLLCSANFYKLPYKRFGVRRVKPNLLPPILYKTIVLRLLYMICSSTKEGAWEHMDQGQFTYRTISRGVPSNGSICRSSKRWYSCITTFRFYEFLYDRNFHQPFQNISNLFFLTHVLWTFAVSALNSEIILSTSGLGVSYNFWVQRLYV